MGEIIDLPSKAAQGMAFLEREIRRIMADSGETEAATNIAIQTLKEVYGRYGDFATKSFSVILPDSIKPDEQTAIQAQIEQGIALLNHEHGHLINQLAAELVLTKIQLNAYTSDSSEP